MANANHMKNILIILPTYNESSDIASIVDVIRSQRLNMNVSVLIIDDNSPDGTGRIAYELSRKFKDVSVLNRETKLGLGKAYIEGFKFALAGNFDYLCEMDADFSHDPRYLVDFCREIETHDLVLGSRYAEGVSIVRWPFLRLVLSFLANKFVKFVTGMPFTDCMGGYKCISTQLIRDITADKIISKGYVFQMEILYRAYMMGARIKEIPIIFYNRKKGRSKMSKSDIFESFFIVLRLRFMLGFRRRRKQRGV